MKCYYSHLDSLSSMEVGSHYSPSHKEEIWELYWNNSIKYRSGKLVFITEQYEKYKKGIKPFSGCFKCSLINLRFCLFLTKGD